jgi:hypothetical protein
MQVTRGKRDIEKRKPLGAQCRGKRQIELTEKKTKGNTISKDILSLAIPINYTKSFLQSVVPFFMIFFLLERLCRSIRKGCEDCCPLG